MHKIDDILAKHFSGLTLTAEEEQHLETWRAQNPKEFEAIAATMAAKHANSYQVFDNRKGWDKMSARIEASATTKTFSLKPFLKYAVAASIAILIGFTGFQFFKEAAPNMLVFENNNTRADSLLLPDGSEIYLAAHSTLKYAANFADNRSLELTGQAFFNVKKSKEKPFTISTENGLVTVLGTSFNVNADQYKTQVDVKTGLVSLRKGTKEIKLAKNESAWASGDKISDKSVVKANTLAWQTGYFNFDNTPFEDVIRFLESFYGDVIDVKTVEKTNCEFTGTFDNEKVTDIIEALVLSCNLEFSKEEGRIMLK